MEFVCTKNNMPDLFVFFKKPGESNIHRPLLSMFKIDSATRTIPLFHLGFKQNMGFLSSNKIVTGVMVFEVLEGYPLQEMMFNQPYADNWFRRNKDRCLEDLDPMDFYCIQKNNKDAYGDFVLKNLKFVDTKMSQSAEDFSRKLIASFVCSSIENFRLPFFFNYFMSDDYDHHIIRSEEEFKNILKDVEAFGDKLPKQIYKNCAYATGETLEFNIGSSQSIILTDLLYKLFEKIKNDWFLRKKHKRASPILRMRDFISMFYGCKNDYEYQNAEYRGDLEFLKVYRDKEKL